MREAIKMRPDYSRDYGSVERCQHRNARIQTLSDVWNLFSTPAYPLPFPYSVRPQAPVFK
jgi:hypothetical protein